MELILFILTYFLFAFNVIGYGNVFAKNILYYNNKITQAKEKAEDQEAKLKKINPYNLFHDLKIMDIRLEIGFGMGDFLFEKALAHPNIGFLGCEVFENGVASLLAKIVKFKITNIIPIVADSAKVSSNWSLKLGMVFIDGGHSYDSANTDYISWESHIAKNGALVIHDIFENPEDGGQAPYEIYQKALKNNYKVYERVDTLVCLIKY